MKSREQPQGNAFLGEYPWGGNLGNARHLTRDRPIGQGQDRVEGVAKWIVAPGSWGGCVRLEDMLGAMLGAIWWVITLPFRLLAWLVEWLGRLTALGLGFFLMVLGVAFGAGPLFIIGIPLFIVGLLITLRSLD